MPMEDVKRPPHVGPREGFYLVWSSPHLPHLMLEPIPCIYDGVVWSKMSFQNPLLSLRTKLHRRVAGDFHGCCSAFTCLHSYVRDVDQLQDHCNRDGWYTGGEP